MIENLKPRQAEILLVDDDEGDMVLAREGFKQDRFAVNMHWVQNGEQCMQFLRKQGQYAHATTPDIILLDLNMPVMDGREVLEAIVEDPKLSHLPVVVLTTSESEKDIVHMYRLRCSSYIVKPVDFAQFVRVVRELNDYWFSLVVLPRADLGSTWPLHGHTASPVGAATP